MHNKRNLMKPKNTNLRKLTALEKIIFYRNYVFYPSGNKYVILKIVYLVHVL